MEFGHEKYRKSVKALSILFNLCYHCSVDKPNQYMSLQFTKLFFLNCAKTKCVVIRSMVLELERPEFETKFLPLKMDSSFSVSPFVTQWWSIWSP